MSDTEPPNKKVKTENENIVNVEYVNKCLENLRSCKRNLDPILAEDYTQPLQLVKVWVGHVKDQKLLSNIVLTLNEKIPLNELSHLKRVRKKEVILCPTHFLDAVTSIQNYIECNAIELISVFEYFKEVDVPLTAPKVKQQMKEAGKYWSCNFHPNFYLERLISGNFFTTNELVKHRKYMEVVFEILKYYTMYLNQNINCIFASINAVIVVDPKTNSVVAAAFDNRTQHPVQHATMLAIDNVAKTQSGGVWVENRQELENRDSTLRGIDKELVNHLQSSFPLVKFFARKFISKVFIDEDERNTDDGPYLCTGYDVYLLREPCVMCAMALIHARAKRLFFCFDNLEHGALKSKTKLQAVASLNHHFEVFTGFL